jgi:hypothetical protein
LDRRNTRIKCPRVRGFEIHPLLRTSQGREIQSRFGVGPDAVTVVAVARESGRSRIARTCFLFARGTGGQGSQMTALQRAAELSKCKASNPISAFISSKLPQTTFITEKALVYCLECPIRWFGQNTVQEESPILICSEKTAQWLIAELVDGRTPSLKDTHNRYDLERNQTAYLRSRDGIPQKEYDEIRLF